MTIKAVLFDHDSTLVESEAIHCEMWIKILNLFDVVLTQELYKKYYAGMPTPSNAADMVERFNLTSSASELIKHKTRDTQDFLSQSAFPLMPGALESIQRLHGRGLKLAIVTGANRVGVNRTASAYNLNHYMSSLVSSDDVTHSKPAPDCYLLAMKQLNVQAGECIAIEDTEHGVKSATAAGISCLAVPTEMSEHHDFTAATGLYGDITEATNWVLDQL